jgi:hypothetical protein
MAETEPYTGIYTNQWVRFCATLALAGAIYRGGVGAYVHHFEANEATFATSLEQVMTKDGFSGITEVEYNHTLGGSYEKDDARVNLYLEQGIGTCIIHDVVLKGIAATDNKATDVQTYVLSVNKAQLTVSNADQLVAQLGKQPCA